MSASLTGPSHNYIQCNVGGCAAVCTGAYTLLAMVNMPGAAHGMVATMRTAAYDRDIIEDTNTLFGVGDFTTGFPTPPTVLTHGDWYIVGQTKPAGAAHYRHHYYDYTVGTGSGVHGEAASSANQSDGTACTSIRVGDGDDVGNGLVAWTALLTRAISDSEFDTICNNQLQNVANLTPQALITLNGWNGATGAVDLVGTSSQSALVGTVSVGADPPGYNFTIGAGAPSKKDGGFFALV